MLFLSAEIGAFVLSSYKARAISGQGGNVKKKFLLAGLLTMTLSSVGTLPSHAASSFDLGVGVYFGTCLSQKVPGNFILQSKVPGSSVWKSLGSSKAWDDRQTEDGQCPKFAAGVFWTPRKVGLFTLRLYNSAQGKTYKSWSIRIVGQTAPTGPTVKMVRMPDITGQMDGQVPWLLTTHGYKFSVMNYPHNIGYNPITSCMMSGTNVVLKQSPAPGLIVENSTNTRVEMWVDCNGN